MQSTFHIKSGSMDIISSGTVIQFDKKPIARAYIIAS
jgi:hypothetical protein